MLQLQNLQEFKHMTKFTSYHKHKHSKYIQPITNVRQFDFARFSVLWD